MLKSLDWAKTIVEKRATVMTSLECISAVNNIGWAIVKDSGGVW